MRAFVSLEWVLLKVHAVEKLQASLLHAVWQKTVAQLTCLHLFSHGKEMVSETDFFGLKQWLCVPLTDTQSVLVAGWARVYSSPTKGHVVPQILQPLQGKCVSWLNQQHQAQMIAPPEGWRLIDWFFFFLFTVEAIAAGESKVNTGFSCLGNGWPRRLLSNARRHTLYFQMMQPD